MFLDPKYQRSFAQPLKQAGYATALAGKWHVNHIQPGNQSRVLRAFGFDEWMAADHDNAAPARVFTHDGGKTLDAFPPDALADFAIDFITRHREQPFFLYWPMHLVHRPLVATPLKPDAEKSIEKQIAMTEYADPPGGTTGAGGRRAGSARRHHRVLLGRQRLHHEPPTITTGRQGLADRGRGER